MLNTKGIQIIKIEDHIKFRFKTFLITNPRLKDSKALLQGIFTTLNKNSKFVNFCNNKVIIVTAIINGHDYSFHNNVLINNLTTFDMYWNKIKG